MRGENETLKAEGKFGKYGNKKKGKGRALEKSKKQERSVKEGEVEQKKRGRGGWSHDRGGFSMGSW